MQKKDFTCIFEFIQYNGYIMKKFTLLAIGSAIGLLCATLSFADEGITPAQAQSMEKTDTAVYRNTTDTKERSLESIELLQGFSWGILRYDKQDKHYRMHPTSVALDFTLKTLTKRWFNFNPAFLLQCQVEPFIGYIASPRNNMEMGIQAYLKVGLVPQTWKFQPYIKGGTGIDYMTLHTWEQSTQFNFISSVGVGFHYFITDNVALTVEGRYRHLSNAGIDQPNHGYEAITTDAGILYKF